jgi:hypothetical protein
MILEPQSPAIHQHTVDEENNEQEDKKQKPVLRTKKNTGGGGLRISRFHEGRSNDLSKSGIMTSQEYSDKIRNI